MARNKEVRITRWDHPKQIIREASIRTPSSREQDRKTLAADVDKFLRSQRG